MTFGFALSFGEVELTKSRIEAFGGGRKPLEKLKGGSLWNGCEELETLRAGEGRRDDSFEIVSIRGFGGGCSRVSCSVGNPCADSRG